MNDYDKAARFAAKQLDPPGFLLWLMGEAFGQAWRWSGWLDTQAVPFPGEPDQRCDTVAAFERRANDRPPLAVVVEFMSETRRAILERLVGYELLVRLEVPYQKQNPSMLYDVMGVVVNLTGASMTGEWSMAPDDCSGIGLWSKAAVINLETMDASAVLAGIDSRSVARCVLSWVPLMRGGDRAAMIAEWKRLAEQEPDAERKSLYAGLALVFAGLAGRQQVWKSELEGWNVLRSPIVLEWEAAEKLRTMRQILLTILEVRVQQAIPSRMTDIIENQDDSAVLETWLRKAAVVSSLEEMNSVLSPNGH